MADLLSSALSGMNAAQFGVATTEHNIANANTPGYTRQQVLLGSAGAQQMGGGFMGQGVSVVGVVRIYDQFLNTQVLQEQNRASYLNTYNSAIQQMADATAGVPAMQGFFDALNGVANNPESVPARQALLGTAQSAVSSFQDIDQRLTAKAKELNGQIVNSANSVNSYAQQIAVLNGSIKRATASGQGQQPNDLIDQRDELISQLNNEIKTTVLQQSDGTASVFIGNGQPLVVDEQAMRLQVVQAANDPSRVDVAYLSSTGKTIPLQQSSLQGGNMGAYLAFRDQTLEPARNKLGLVALGMAANLNQQNQLGQDLNGTLGGALFKVASPRVDKNASNDPLSGVPSVTIADVSKLTTSDYRLTFNGGTSYTLLRLSDNVTTSLDLTTPQTVDGVTITAPATVTAGDNFTIRPTANGARDIQMATDDPAKIAAAAPMRAIAALANIGSATISSGSVSTIVTPNPAHPATDLNLQTTVTIAFTSSTTFTVAGAMPPVGVQTYVAGQDISYNGWTVQITGAPVAGDVFTIGKNTNATGDNRNALLMASMQTQNLMGNGTVSLQGAYGQLVSEISTKASELSVTSLAQNNMVAQTVAAQQAVSGVNLDEEAANLIRYQNAYQAAAKAMQIAKTMFDAILSINP